MATPWGRWSNFEPVCHPRQPTAPGSLPAGIGDRDGAFSWRLSANHLDTLAQPLSYVTLTQPAATSKAGTVLTGAFNDLNSHRRAHHR